MTDITVTDTPHGLHLDTDGGTPVTLSPDAVTAIVQHELGKLGLWWAKEQRALVTTTPVDDGDHGVFFLNHLATGVHWATPGDRATTPTGRRLNDTLDAYLASLPVEPKPGEIWELRVDGMRASARVIDGPSGTPCFLWLHPTSMLPCVAEASLWVDRRRKIIDAPTTALDKVRAALANHPRCDRHDDDDPVTCGWKSAVLDVQAALDGADQ